MNLQGRIFVLSVLICAATFSGAQNNSSDEKAVTILSQTLSASAASNVQAFTATGTMTYFWAGQEVQSNATIRAKGGDQFRLDADIPGGTQSFALDRRSGSRKDTDGKLTDIPAHNTLSAGILTFPYPSIAATLSDTNAKVSYIGLVEADGRQFHQVRVTRIFPEESDPDGLLASMSAIDYFIDAQTLLVVRTSDLTHPKETITESYTHDIEFENYETISGVAVPTRVREKVGGQTTWEFRLSNINFNASVSDEEFSLL